MKNNPRIFFDISGLLEHIKSGNHYTGIQRVVSMIVSEMGSVYDPSSIYISYRDSSDGLGKCVLAKDIGKKELRSAPIMRAKFFLDGRLDTTQDILRQYSKKPIKMRYNKLRLDINAALGKERVFRKLGITAKEWKAIRSIKEKTPSLGAMSVHRLDDMMRSGDKVVLLDASWDEKYFEYFKNMRSIGCHVYTMVHDLIPIIIPEMMPTKLPITFKKWLESSTEFTDTYLSVSQATRNDLKKFLLENYPDTVIDIHVLPLAQELFNAQDASSRSLDKELSEIVRLPHKTRAVLAFPYVLCVGTLELRKNIWRLVLSWKHLLDQGLVDLPRLVIVGKKTVMGDALEDLLEGTGNLFGYVTFVDSPSEEELAQLYRKCLFLAMPSLYEGWGLPVGEALSFGKTAVVSTSSSLPEVGGELVEYCDPESVVSIADAVRRLVGDPDHRAALEARIRQTQLRSWSHVAADLKALLGA